MLGRIQHRGSNNNAAKLNYNKKSTNSVPPVSNKNGKHENCMKKINNRRRRAEIGSIKRAQRHLLIDSENKPIQSKKKKRETENVKVKKKKKRNCNGRSGGVSLTSCSDEIRNICSKTEENSDNDMSDHSGGGQMPIKKRGHQHHPRFAGQRRSNVPAEEVLAALRRGGIVEMSKVMRTADILVDTPPQGELLEGRQSVAIDISDQEKESHDDGDKPQLTVMTSALPDDIRNGESLEDFNRNVIGCDADVVHDAENNTISGNIATSALPDTPLNLNSCSTSLPSSCNITPTDDSNLTRESKPKSNKSTNRDKTKDYIKSSKNEEKKRRKQQQQQKRDSQVQGEFPKQERSSGDGAPADDNADTENDPEAEEWARLRCTSERTEVVAERENRKHRARCADYPGLAFGRSIFSSDTMMKFNIIRNELHNIMKTQLKRVKDCFGSRIF